MLSILTFTILVSSSQDVLASSPPILSAKTAVERGIRGEKGCFVDLEENLKARPRLDSGAAKQPLPSGLMDGSPSSRALVGTVDAWTTEGFLPPVLGEAKIQRSPDVFVESINPFLPPYETTANYQGLWKLQVPFASGTLRSDYHSEELRIWSMLDGSGTEELCENGVCYDVFRQYGDWDFHVGESRLSFLLGDMHEQGPTEYSAAAGNAYVHTKASIEWIRSFLEQWDMEGLPGLSALTNVSLFSCNAFYSPSLNRMLFMASQGDCSNTSYSTVNRHEFGHAYVTTLPLHDDPDQLEDYAGFHEGMADTLSALSLDTPCIALDLSGENTGCLRDLEESDAIYPIDDPSPHVRGRPLSAAYWKLHQMLKAEYADDGLKYSKQLFLQASQLNTTGLSRKIGQDVLDANEILFDDPLIDAMIISAFSAHGLMEQ